jgi:hypothetical protein
MSLKIAINGDGINIAGTGETDSKGSGEIEEVDVDARKPAFVEAPDNNPPCFVISVQLHGELVLATPNPRQIAELRHHPSLPRGYVSYNNATAEPLWPPRHRPGRNRNRLAFRR